MRTLTMCFGLGLPDADGQAGRRAEVHLCQSAPAKLGEREHMIFSRPIFRGSGYF